jgi:hypothetical protein
LRITPHTQRLGLLPSLRLFSVIKAPAKRRVFCDEVCAEGSHKPWIRRDPNNRHIDIRTLEVVFDPSKPSTRHDPEADRHYDIETGDITFKSPKTSERRDHNFQEYVDPATSKPISGRTTGMKKKGTLWDDLNYLVRFTIWGGIGVFCGLVFLIYLLFAVGSFISGDGASTLMGVLLIGGLVGGFFAFITYIINEVGRS